MNAPKFPALFISQTDRDNLTSVKKELVVEITNGTITLGPDYPNQFSTISQGLSKTPYIKQFSMTIQKINGHGLLNTVFEIATLPVGFRPINNISTTFPYGASITDVGQIHLTTAGLLSIRTGDTAYFPNGSSATISLLYL
jgi:hypothetical protein